MMNLHEDYIFTEHVSFAEFMKFKSLKTLYEYGTLVTTPCMHRSVRVSIDIDIGVLISLIS